MSFHATNPAGFSDLFRCVMKQANKNFSTGNYGDELRPSCGGYARSNRAPIGVNFRKPVCE